MSLLIRLSLISFLFFATISKEVFAYKCSIMSPEYAYDRSEIVFSGTVKKVTYLQDSNSKSKSKSNLCGSKLVIFKIEKIWKGNKQKEVAIYLENSCKKYPNRFQEGTKYLVYAYKKPGNISDININYRYNISSCSRTKEMRYYLPDIIEDIKFLGEPKYIIKSNYSCVKEEKFLKQQTRENIYPCKTDEDCAIVGANSCCFTRGSCIVAVNKSVQKILQDDLKLFNFCAAAACKYDCIGVGPAVCNDSKLCGF